MDEIQEPERPDPLDTGEGGGGAETRDGDAGGDGPARVPRPIPVRAPRPVTGDREAARATTPRPVRSGLDTPEPPETPGGSPEEESVRLELDDRTLVVHVRGRARGHTSQGKADLLLLGFHDEGEDEPVREALVVGSSLAALTPFRLEAAWRAGRTPRDPFAPTELFPETDRNRGRGR